MSPQFEALYLQHAVAAYEKQLKLAEVIGERSWSFSMESGQLVFGSEDPASSLIFAAQLLGTASDASNSWLWSWANDTSQIPPSLTQDALRLRASGDHGAPPEWGSAQFTLDFDEADDHRVSMTACGILGSDAYYCGPYAEGAAFFLLRDPRLQYPAPDVLRIISVFTQAISSVPLSRHRAAFLGYLQGYGLTPQFGDDGSVSATIAGKAVSATFDAAERLTEVKGQS